MIKRQTMLAILLLIGACSDAKGLDQQKVAQVHFAGTAFEDDCASARPNKDGTVQFMVPCPESAMSPDGKWRLVQTKAVGENEVYRVYVAGAGGKELGEVPGLNDGMPFVLWWSPRKDWFAVQHHIGSFMDVPEIFQITAGGVIERDQFAHAAQAKAHEMYPCLPPDRKDIWLAGSIFSLSRSGDRLAWAFTTRPDACAPPGYVGSLDKPEWRWHSFLMISNLDTGKIVPGSVRVLDDDKPFADEKLPRDGPYENF